MTEEIPIWRIKYLPKNLEEICGREDIIDRLKKIIQEKNFPHLLFVGTNGVGKTTIAELFSKEFLGEFFDANYKLVHADVPLTSEERQHARTDSYVSTTRIGSMAGKTLTMPAFIQVKVKPFVELKAFGEVPFKILVVKNFEALGSNQQGFRRLMEIYGSNCRMIIITTKVSGIIDPILSRCQLFIISQVSYESFKRYIHAIIEKEQLKVKEDVIEILYQISKGNISHALDQLQLASISGNEIDSNMIYENYKKYQNKEVKELLLLMIKGDFKEARNKAREIISSYKYSMKEILFQILQEINKLPISRFAKIKLIDVIAEIDLRSIDGQDSDIQLSALISKISTFSESL